MGIIEWAIIVVLTTALILAVVYCVRRVKSGKCIGCSGNCSGCAKAAKPSKENEELTHNADRSIHTHNVE